MREPRPQLTAEQAARHRVEDYLALGPGPFVPLSRETIAALPADFTVDAKGAGTHRSVQAAVDAVPPAGVAVAAGAAGSAGAAARRYVIDIRPGTYREPLCVRDKVPLLLRGTGGDAQAVRLVEGRWNGRPKAPGEPAHPCVPALQATTHGTSGSTSVALFSDDVVVAHLGIANDATEGAAAREGGHQAVALTTAGDRIQLENVRLTSHQDTFYARRAERDRPARVFVRASFIAGDVDFVFGNATLVIEGSTLHSRADRGPGREARAGGIVLAPSTPPEVPLGMLVIRGRFTADPALRAGSVALGRAWDQGVPRGTWAAGVSPNGQAVVRESELGPHIGPWVDSTSARPVRATGAVAHRLAEFGNRSGP
jgi:pectin methylesterase-like acyl-CoA thioesterase